MISGRAKDFLGRMINYYFSELNKLPDKYESRCISFCNKESYYNEIDRLDKMLRSSTTYDYYVGIKDLFEKEDGDYENFDLLLSLFVEIKIEGKKIIFLPKNVEERYERDEAVINAAWQFSGDWIN